jgi:hypothetical protein
MREVGTDLVDTSAAATSVPCSAGRPQGFSRFDAISHRGVIELVAERQSRR